MRLKRLTMMAGKIEKEILDKLFITDLFCIAEKKAIVVGGAGDLGRGMLEALLEAGAECVVIDKDEKLKDCCESLLKKG